MGITCAIYGEPKIGKTWLGGTAPKPLLLLDAEAGGTDYVPVSKQPWDATGPPPDPGDGAAVVSVKDVSDVLRAISWARDASAWPFRSVVLDSLTELQARCRRKIAGSGVMEIPDWGVLLGQMERVVGNLRDLAAFVPGTELCAIVCGATMDDSGRMAPKLQGASASMLQYAVDILMFLSLVQTSAGPGSYTRQALLAPRPHAAAGNRLGGLLPDTISDPDLSAIVAALNSGEAGQSDV